MALRRVPHIGLGYGLRHLINGGHPVLGTILVAIIVVAIVMAARNSRR